MTTADYVDGGTGNDQAGLQGDYADGPTLGAGGADQLRGGGGADTLTGGAGNDVFVYAGTAESSASASDQILDFATGDHIDLSAIDALAGTGGNDAFSFIGAAAFSHTAGELLPERRLVRRRRHRRQRHRPTSSSPSPPTTRSPERTSCCSYVDLPEGCRQSNRNSSPIDAPVS